LVLIDSNTYLKMGYIFKNGLYISGNWHDMDKRYGGYHHFVKKGCMKVYAIITLILDNLAMDGHVPLTMDEIHQYGTNLSWGMSDDGKEQLPNDVRCRAYMTLLQGFRDYCNHEHNGKCGCWVTDTWGSEEALEEIVRIRAAKILQKFYLEVIYPKNLTSRWNTQASSDNYQMVITRYRDVQTPELTYEEMIAITEARDENLKMQREMRDQYYRKRGPPYMWKPGDCHGSGSFGSGCTRNMCMCFFITRYWNIWEAFKKSESAGPYNEICARIKACGEECKPIQEEYAERIAAYWAPWKKLRAMGGLSSGPDAILFYYETLEPLEDDIEDYLNQMEEVTAKYSNEASGYSFLLREFEMIFNRGEYYKKYLNQFYRSVWYWPENKGECRPRIKRIELNNV